MQVKGELNPEGLMGKNDKVRVGFSSFRIVAKLDAALSLEYKKAFILPTVRFSGRKTTRQYILPSS